MQHEFIIITALKYRLNLYFYSYFKLHVKKINMNNFHNEALVFKLIECVCAFEPTETDECKQCINNNVYQSSEVYLIYITIYTCIFSTDGRIGFGCPICLYQTTKPL